MNFKNLLCFLLLNLIIVSCTTNENVNESKDITFTLTGSSNLGCNTSLGSVDYGITFYIDDKEVSSKTETISEISEFKNEFSGEGKTFKIALRLVDFDEKNSSKDIGEVLEKLEIGIKNQGLGIDLKKSINSLFICTDITYGVDILFNSETKDINFEYYSANNNQQNKDINFTLTGSSNLGCNTSLGSVDYGVKFYVDDKEVSSKTETISEVAEFKNEFSGEGKTFKIALRLVDFDEKNSSKDIGEVLEKLEIGIKNQDLGIDLKKSINSLFVCTDITYGVDILFNSETKNINFEYYSANNNQQNKDINFTLTGSSNLGCNTSLGSVDYGIKFYIDDKEVSSKTETINEIAEFKNEFSGEGKTFKIALRLVDFDEKNSSKDIGEVLEKLEIGIKNQDLSIDLKKSINSLFVCTDITYGVDILFNSETKDINFEYYSANNNQQNKDIAFTLTGLSTSGCSAKSLSSVDYGVKFYVDNKEVSSKTETVNESTEFKNEFSGEGTNFKIAVRLVDFDKNNASKDLGEALDNLNIEIKNQNLGIDLKKSINRLFICYDITYGVDILFNTETKKVNTEYYVTQYNPDEGNTISFTLTGSSNTRCDKTLTSVDYGIKFYVDDKEVSSKTETVDTSKTFKNEFSGDGNTFKIALRLVDFDENNKSKDLGEALENLKIKIGNQNLGINEESVLESLFICTDSMYGVDILFNRDTKKIDYKYYTEGL